MYPRIPAVLPPYHELLALARIQALVNEATELRGQIECLEIELVNAEIRAEEAEYGAQGVGSRLRAA